MPLDTRSRTCAFDYTNDAGIVWQIQLSENLASIGQLNINLSPAGAAATFPPPRFQPRGVYWAENGGSNRRRFLVCAADSPLYSANTSTALTIDGVDGRITGRAGESLTFPSVGHSNPLAT